MKFRELIRLLHDLGAVQIRQTGSHRRYKLGNSFTIVAPHALGDDVPPGTLKKIELDLQTELGISWLKKYRK